jgi:hypothetical protein
MPKVNRNYLLIAVGLLLAIYYLYPEKWRGYAYPKKDNLSNSIYLGEFKSEDECNVAAINTLRRVSSVSAGDYECHKD